MLSLIAAMAKNKVIGLDNKLPWNLPEDLKRFRQLTTGKIVLMGRKTYESIGKPLPKRINIIVSKNMEIPTNISTLESGAPALMIYRDLQSALSSCEAWIENFKLPNEIMIIGGGKIYEQTIGSADRMYLTVLDKEYEGDASFPEFSEEHWHETETESKDGYKNITYNRFVTND